ncbi:unnamed protein product [Knipowitschia caucasica]
MVKTLQRNPVFGLFQQHNCILLSALAPGSCCHPSELLTSVWETAGWSNPYRPKHGPADPPRLGEEHAHSHHGVGNNRFMKVNEFHTLT